jgi:hypothetical protein
MRRRGQGRRVGAWTGVGFLARIAAIFYFVLAPAVALGGGENKGAAKPRNVGLLARFEKFCDRLSSVPDSIVVPSAEFFTLVMLEQLSRGSSKDDLDSLVGIREWKSGGSAGFGKVGGWRDLHSVWKIDSFVRPSNFGIEVTQLYRTTLLDPSRPLPQGTKLPEGGLDLGDLNWPKQSELITVAEISPKWAGGLKRAGGENGGEDILQTHIVTAGYFESQGTGEWVISLPLHGGGSFLISQNAIPKDIATEERDIIVFIPEFRRTSTYQWEERAGKTSIVGQVSDYGGLCDDGGALRLDSWTIRATLTIEGHDAPSLDQVDKSSSRASSAAPLVVRVKYPFFVQVRGSHGEILLEGQIKKENGDDSR